jgi:acetyltransferase-like isoleucine patch superfamily enzyme
MPKNIIKLKKISPNEIPADLRYETYFDFKRYPFEHQKLFTSTTSVCDAISQINNYANKWLKQAEENISTNCKIIKNKASSHTYTIGYFQLVITKEAICEPARIIGSQVKNNRYSLIICKGARLIGADIYLDEGSIFIGPNCIVEPGTVIKGPAIIGKHTEVRHGAYLRGNVILGDEVIIRGEVKNAVLMNNACFPHPCYVGDSLCGYKTHFGNQVTSANFNIFGGIQPKTHQNPIIIECEGKLYDTGLSKMGICMGDFSQIGCHSVSDPGTFLKPYTIVYPMTRIKKGFYGPEVIIKSIPQYTQVPLEKFHK